MSASEAGKKHAAYAAVDNHVKNHCRVGIGSGSTIVYAVERLVQRIREEKLEVLCVPTSFQSRLLLVEGNVPHTDLLGCHELDVVIDGADEVDADLTLIKGGGGCHLQEKLVAAAGAVMVVVADDGKRSTRLGEKWKKGVPIEVVPMAHAAVAHQLRGALADLTQEVVLRRAVAKAGPVVTDNGNFILDWQFRTDVTIDWGQVDQRLHMIPGVVETGIFHKMAKHAYFGSAEGVQIVDA